MSATTQHEFHPDPEMLSAFAEQALNERERDEVLEHLAACGRCRQVVALAREAADAEAVQKVVVQPRVWWRSWGLALAPAAVAVTAVAAIYVHVRKTERNAQVAKLEQQRTDEKAPTPPPAAPARPVKPTASESKSDRAGDRQGEREREVRESRQAQEDFVDRFEVEGRRIHTAGEERERDRALESPAPAPPGSEPETDDRTPPEVAMHDEEWRKEAKEAEEERHLYAAEATAPSNLHGSEGGATEANHPVDLSAQQVETRPAPELSPGSLIRLRAGTFSPALTAGSIHLPSGLRAISIAHEGPRMLAIDEAGALFLSENSGTNWETVTTQWTGRAVMVRKDAAANLAAAAPTAAKSEPSRDTSGSGEVSETGTVFALTNDQGQVWWSADGRIWNAK